MTSSGTFDRPRTLPGRLVSIVALIVASLLVFQVGAATAHQGDSNFRSIINSITPASLAEGLKVDVVNFDDHVVLENESGREVEILGYDGEPYVRIMADGTVEVNLNSPSHYLNQDRYADVALPSRADPDAAPEWKRVGDNGRYEWHDHRSHYMSEGVPPQVKDEAEKTKIFDYSIPLMVDGSPAKVNGTLYWAPEDHHEPEAEEGVQVLPFILLGLVTVAGLIALGLRRRRRDPGRE